MPRNAMVIAAILGARIGKRDLDSGTRRSPLSRGIVGRVTPGNRRSWRTCTWCAGTDSYECQPVRSCENSCICCKGSGIATCVVCDVTGHEPVEEVAE